MDAWHEETEHTDSIKVPHNGILITDGAAYTVASLMDHLGTTEHIWWAFQPFLSGDITETHTSFTVTLDSSAHRIDRSSEINLFLASQSYKESGG